MPPSLPGPETRRYCPATMTDRTAHLLGRRTSSGAAAIQPGAPAMRPSSCLCVDRHRRNTTTIRRRWGQGKYVLPWSISIVRHGSVVPSSLATNLSLVTNIALACVAACAVARPAHRPRHHNNTHQQQYAHSSHSVSLASGDCTPLLQVRY